MNRFDEFKPFVNRVKANVKNQIFSLPINLHTINQFFKKSFTPIQAAAFIASKTDKTIINPTNFEEQALKLIGPELYKTFLYGYTKKQWGREPKELPAHILTRLPLRFNYDDNYYNHPFQGIPTNGYTYVVERILDHPNIQVQLNTGFLKEMEKEYEHVFYSGCIDEYFNFIYGQLEYRSLQFEEYRTTGDFQGNPVINYCDEGTPYTRITEHKHFSPWTQHNDTIYFKEYSIAHEPKKTIPYYPVRLAQDKNLLALYQESASKLTQMTFIGRLGTYQYLDMDKVIVQSLNIANEFLSK